MVGKDEALAMIVEDLQLEEIYVTSRLEAVLAKLRRSDIDERVKDKIEKGVTHLLEETMWHSKTLTELLKKVAGGGELEY